MLTPCQALCKISFKILQINLLRTILVLEKGTLRFRTNCSDVQLQCGGAAIKITTAAALHALSSAVPPLKAWLATGLHHFSTACSWHLLGCLTPALSGQPPGLISLRACPAVGGGGGQKRSHQFIPAPHSFLPDPGRSHEVSESKRR